VETSRSSVAIDAADDLTRSGLARIAQRAGLAVDAGGPIMSRSAREPPTAGAAGREAEVTVTERHLAVLIELGSSQSVLDALIALLVELSGSR
jgi:hypothetical protein